MNWLREEELIKMASGDYLPPMREGKTTYSKLIAQARAAFLFRDALIKIKNGPGNNMASWVVTWAHEVSANAILEANKLKDRE